MTEASSAQRRDRIGQSVAVGGLGGSGTRVVAQVLQQLGFYLGSDLNRSLDNLWFTLLFKERVIVGLSNEEFQARVDLFLKAMSSEKPFTNAEAAELSKLAQQSRLQHPASWLRRRVESMIRAGVGSGDKRDRWGWKEPNTHIVIDRLLQRIPSLKYIHVIRNGLDMALSANQNQLVLWGPDIVGKIGKQPSFRESLRFWCAVHRRMVDLAESEPGRVLLLSFDCLCSDTTKTLEGLLLFLGVRSSGPVLRRLSEVVVAPDSIGRFRAVGLEEFDSVDVDFVASLGFATDPGSGDEV